MTLQTILMDVDGTMTDISSAGAKTAESDPMEILKRLVMERHAVNATTAERMIRDCGDPGIHCLSEFLPGLQVDPDAYFDALHRELAKSIVIPEDTVAFLRAMKQKGIRVCSATTNSRFMTLAKLSVAGLADRHGCPYLSAFHSGNEFHDPEGKFSEHFFPNILKRHNYDPETTMMIGDDPERDLYPAQKAGIRCCAILCRTQTQPVLFKNGGIFVRSLKILADSIAAN